MILRPASIGELAAAVAATPRIAVRGGGTKPGLQRADGAARLELDALAGLLEHRPEECTFTALAGTPVGDIERALAPHGQYIPFDPPLAARGATIGGTVAAGINGSCRYRYGGVRDFLIGARIVDGRGQVVSTGGKVVKNAAGFLLHHAMAGSCGRLGVLAELTFKVFPAPAARASLRLRAPHRAAALDRMHALVRSGLDLEALDLDAPATLWTRIAGRPEGLRARIDTAASVLGPGADVIEGPDESAIWRDAAEHAWVPAGTTLVRVPLNPARVAELDAVAERQDARRRYAVAGNVAWLAWPGDLEALSGALAGMGLIGQVLTGSAGRPWIGRARQDAFERRVRAVMDPDARFAER